MEARPAPPLLLLPFPEIHWWKSTALQLCLRNRQGADKWESPRAVADFWEHWLQLRDHWLRLASFSARRPRQTPQEASPALDRPEIPTKNSASPRSSMRKAR